MIYFVKWQKIRVSSQLCLKFLLLYYILYCFLPVVGTAHGDACDASWFGDTVRPHSAERKSLCLGSVTQAAPAWLSYDQMHYYSFHLLLTVAGL